MAARKILIFSISATLSLAASPAFAASCESLAALKLANTTITSANPVAAVAFRRSVGSATHFSTLPAFCRVAATLKPSSDSDIKIEFRLPVSGWSGKFQAVGNGGFGGVISYSALAALASGYASASTDAGHQGNTATFALGHP